MHTELREVVQRSLAGLRQISEEQAAVKPALNKWSCKEILGHLIDSAANNHQRFIRLQLAPELTLPGYDQDGWVSANRYQERSWASLVSLWEAYNLHLASVIEAIDPGIGDRVWHHPSQDYTLAFIANDYVVHLEHHLAQITALQPAHRP